MSAADVIRNYESLSSLTARMRDAAANGEWETLISLEQQCSRHVDAMKPADIATTLDEYSRRRKIELIKKILDDDADIRSRTQAWMAQLQRLIQSGQQEQRLHSVYGV